ncbi:TonB-dependent receptor [Sphingopyxis sp. RIFCSPHIGHO2_12_FULL_65_19]|uniref:TonB-dependent receptor n=1 Tax=Sphingopyxis sp. RIFCSPHIGHO2_12_FULL_65_19 TaxID=1802172 RepID=UPI0008AE836B|nr:TonB-dependent receptor [Sphingopyxis sp. RIFCSPHIGHO2_12_FULL_65_19]OHD08293.1 MAG: TonB-dependent receptor [Sphingopyxis sp. RIFCSPHIGHO2_12_FULL_65_19]
MAIHAMRSIRTLTRLACGASLAVLAVSPAWAQDAVQDSADPVASEDEIVVTGFRASLDKALGQKRDSISAVDVIVAEDIAKFPDQNLAESLQRIPGISIQRDAGEGRAITVRGLGAQFTRVRLNGMETIATSTDGASANRDRAFDFNVFASELFTSLVVHKTASASLDEGSLGAVVDLNTGNPLGGKEGLTLVASAQARYNDLTKDVDPRLAGLIAWTNVDRTFGVSASVAWSDYGTDELGNNTVRWAQAPFRSVDGVTCLAGSNFVASPSAGCVEVAEAFHPRIPRYGLVSHDRSRLGATASIQFEPSENTKISIDGLYSKFKETRDEYWGEVLLRSNERSIDLSNYTIDANNNLIAADLDNVYVRTERYSRQSETEFYQLSGRLEQRLTDALGVKLIAGFSKSQADIPVETTLAFDDRDATGYRFDYTDMKYPVLSFGPGIEDPTAFQLAEFRDRPSYQTNKFKTFAADFDWQVADRFKLLAGGFYRQFDFDTVQFSRDSTYCAAFTCAPGTNGLPVTSDIAELFNLGDAGQPAGNTNAWIVPDLDAGTALIDLYNRPAVLQQGQQRAVTEKTYGGWFMTEFETDVLGMRLTGNAGVRYVKTDQSSSGFASGTFVTVDRTYDDWLPSFNVNLHPTENLILRGAIAKVITRPTLGSLSPGGTVDQFNFRITSGNPFLDPYRATTFDLAAEWYFAPGAIASVALFAKDIESFPISTSLQGTYASSGLPLSLLTPGTPAYVAVVDGDDPNRQFEFRTTGNGPGANLKGVELSLQLPFSVFSDSLRHFGVLGNATFVKSDVDYTVAGPLAYDPADNRLESQPAGTYTQPLLGLAKRAWNATVYYDDGKFSIRSSAAWRSGYNDSTSGNNNIFEGYGSSFNVDASIRYQVTEQIEVSIEGTNLTDDYRYRFNDIFAGRNYENNHYGRTFLFGARVKI